MSEPFGRRGNISPRALVGGILFINGAIFWAMAALLAVLALLVQPDASVLRLLALVFVGVGTLEALAGALVRLFPGGDSPTARLVNHYYAALARQDYATAYSDLDLAPGAFGGPTLIEADFARRAREVDAEQGLVTDYALAGVQANPGRRVFTISVTRGSGSYRARLTLARQGAGWKITGFDRF
ncbi:MAG TPA: hypothetical protein VF808_18370 [Ktedonobacterales bacterium]